jgi:uncharacterized membrane protein YedE/YeeE
VLFAIGLDIAGMTQPSKVLAFLDISGAWDPSLAFVMVGAIGVAAIAFRLRARLRSPLLGGRFEVGSGGGVMDARLLVGAALFGVGWGLSGLCPGPAVVTLVRGHAGPFVFMASMLGGMAIHRLVYSRERAPREEDAIASRSPDDKPAEQATATR